MEDDSTVKARWWLTPMVLVLLGGVPVLASLVAQPDATGEWTLIAGERFGVACGFLENTGRPCPGCGMTRSWVWTVRGQLMKGFRYHPAGALLLLGLGTSAVLGAIRLIRQDPKVARLPFKWTSILAVGWAVLYAGQAVARYLGYFPLP